MEKFVKYLNELIDHYEDITTQEIKDRLVETTPPDDAVSCLILAYCCVNKLLKTLKEIIKEKTLKEIIKEIKEIIVGIMFLDIKFFEVIEGKELTLYKEIEYEKIKNLQSISQEIENLINEVLQISLFERGNKKVYYKGLISNYRIVEEVEEGEQKIDKYERKLKIKGKKVEKLIKKIRKLLEREERGKSGEEYKTLADLIDDMWINISNTIDKMIGNILRETLNGNYALTPQKFWEALIHKMLYIEQNIERKKNIEEGKKRGAIDEIIHQAKKMLDALRKDEVKGRDEINKTHTEVPREGRIEFILKMLIFLVNNKKELKETLDNFEEIATERENRKFKYRSVERAKNILRNILNSDRETKIHEFVDKMGEEIEKNFIKKKKWDIILKCPIDVESKVELFDFAYQLNKKLEPIIKERKEYLKMKVTPKLLKIEKVKYKKLRECFEKSFKEKRNPSSAFNCFITKITKEERLLNLFHKWLNSQNLIGKISKNEVKELRRTLDNEKKKEIIEEIMKINREDYQELKKILEDSSIKERKTDDAFNYFIKTIIKKEELLIIFYSWLFDEFDEGFFRGLFEEEKNIQKETKIVRIDDEKIKSLFEEKYYITTGDTNQKLSLKLSFFIVSEIFHLPFWYDTFKFELFIFFLYFLKNLNDEEKIEKIWDSLNLKKKQIIFEGAKKIHECESKIEPIGELIKKAVLEYLKNPKKSEKIKRIKEKYKELIMLIMMEIKKPKFERHNKITLKEFISALKGAYESLKTILESYSSYIYKFTKKEVKLYEEFKDNFLDKKFKDEKEVNKEMKKLNTNLKQLRKRIMIGQGDYKGLVDFFVEHVFQQEAKDGNFKNLSNRD